MNADLDHWIVSTPALLGGNVAGLRTPDAATALVIDGYATGDGKNFHVPPFANGEPDATFMILPQDTGDRLYQRMADYVGSRKSRDENLEEENQVLVAKWDVSEGQVAILVADSGGVEHAQDTFEQFLGLEKIQLHSSNKAVISSRFDAAELLSSDRAVFSEEARQALESLRMPAPAPSPSSRTRKP